MHNIVRTNEPASLKRNKDKWTEELLDEISQKGDFSKVDSKFKLRYKQDDVSEALKKMNGEGNGYCYYCEQKLGKTDYGQIEHFKPKKTFPELCFEWENLHWSCQKCNVKKGVSWNYENPILDPCDIETNINDHITYGSWKLVGETDSALTTIDVFFLNDENERADLVSARRKVWIELLQVIGEYNNAIDSVDKRKKITNLKTHSLEFEYTGMIEFALKTYLKDDNF